MKPLEKKYPGSYLTLNNKLTQLQEDDIVEEVFTEGDVLTGLKMKHNVERNGVKWCDKPAGDIVVLSNLITKQPLVVESKYEQKFQFKPAEFSSTVSIFWKQWDETSRVVEEDKEEITREERMVGEDAVLLGKKYLIPQVCRIKQNPPYLGYVLPFALSLWHKGACNNQPIRAQC